MKKLTSTLVKLGMMFFLVLAAVGCAQTGSDTMNGPNMETHMESKSDDSMDKSMETSMDSMNEEKMGSGMEKSMDTMDAEKMDGSMKKDLQDDMK